MSACTEHPDWKVGDAQAVPIPSWIGENYKFEVVDIASVDGKMVKTVSL